MQSSAPAAGGVPPAATLAAQQGAEKDAVTCLLASYSFRCPEVTTPPSLQCIALLMHQVYFHNGSQHTCKRALSRRQMDEQGVCSTFAAEEDAAAPSLSSRVLLIELDEDGSSGWCLRSQEVRCVIAGAHQQLCHMCSKCT